MNTTEQAKCLKCHRTLTSAKSIAAGYGPTCARKVRHTSADLADFTPSQIASAHELIEDAAIVPLRGLVFRTVSTDGAELHLTHPATCNCPAGRRSARPCYHQLAARMLLAA
jgi:hypothetical protein